MNIFRKFFSTHPDVITAVKALEHAGFDAAEDLVLGAIESRLGFVSKLLPLATIADAGKGAAEGAIDSKLDELDAPDTSSPATSPAPMTAPPAPAANTTPLAITPAAIAKVPAAPVNLISSDPRMAAKQAVAAVRNIVGESPTGTPIEVKADDGAQYGTPS